MPELPEVEVLCRHLAPLVRGRTIRGVEVRRPKIVLPDAPADFAAALTGAKILSLSRRAKYLVFTLRAAGRRERFLLLGHLGMTGRMFVEPPGATLPKHTAVVFELDRRQRFVFEDTRVFGRLSRDTAPLGTLGPEPLGEGFTPEAFAAALRRSSQAIKVKLLDQTLVAGIGNIYASESLFRACISPRLAARRLAPAQVRSLWRTIREVLSEAIAWGSTVPLSFGDGGARDGLFYFGQADGTTAYYHERLLVYDRAGQPCVVCGAPIRRFVQAARSTFQCPRCQSGRAAPRVP
jgi:formamidopyrimidine-DNA glycosylase